MVTAGRELLAELVQGSLRLTYIEGAVNPVYPGYTTGWRSMPFCVITQWRLQPARFERDGHEAQIVQPGHCVVLPPGLKHCLTALGGGPAECRWAHFQATVLGAHDLLTLLGIPLVHAPPAADALGDICAALAQLPWSGDDLTLVGLARRKELDLRLIGQVASLAPDPGAWEEALRRADRMLPVLRHIEAHWADGIDSVRLTRLADLAGLSRSRFHSVFHEAMGMTPMEYVRRIRIAEAQRLLVTTDQPVSRIAEQVGCPDQFHFSRQFKAVCGVTPAAFRRQSKTGVRPGR